MDHSCEPIPPRLHFLMMESLFRLRLLVWVRGLSNQVAVTFEQAPFDTGGPEVNHQPSGVLHFFSSV